MKYNILMNSSNTLSHFGHSFCFECLKKPHGNLPCEINDLDKSIINYGMNNFIKKCPQCKIIIEKNKGCNHITCTKCGFQWCWLCNEKYDETHFNKGKCEGFQFFQPKNDYDIKLMMEGKIKPNELPNSQRQFHYNLDNHLEINIPVVNRIENRMNHNIRYNEIEIRYNRNKCWEILCKILLFIFFGNFFCFTKGIDFEKFNVCVSLVTYALIFIAFFFQMIFINLISLILIFIFIGFKKFIADFDNLNRFYAEKFFNIMLNLSFGLLLRMLYYWEKMINRTHIYHDSFLKIIILFSFFLMTIVILYPYHLLINIIGVISCYFNDDRFSCFNDRFTITYY